jgi:hypothetical protein
VAEIVARYEAGEPSTALAAAFDLSKGSVIRLLREANITIRNQPLTDDHPTWLKLVHTPGADLDERVAEVVG